MLSEKYLNDLISIEHSGVSIRKTTVMFNRVNENSCIIFNQEKNPEDYILREIILNSIRKIIKYPNTLFF